MAKKQSYASKMAKSRNDVVNSYEYKNKTNTPVSVGSYAAWKADPNKYKKPETAKNTTEAALQEYIKQKTNAFDASTLDKFKGQTMSSASASDIVNNRVQESFKPTVKEQLQNIYRNGSTSGNFGSILTPALKSTGNRHNIDTNSIYKTDDISAERISEFRNAAETDSRNPIVNYKNLPEGNDKKIYANMSDEEKNRYNEIYGVYGADQAEEYKNLIMDDINKRIAASDYEAMQKRGANTLTNTIYSLSSGIARGTKGIAEEGSALLGLGNSKATSTDDYVSSYIRNDENNSKAQQMLYDVASSTGNMIPGIAASMVTGSGLAGNVVFAISAGGQAYREAINAGEDTSTAGLYSAQQSVDESATNFLLGGIDKFGGGAVKKAISRIGGKRFTDALNAVVKSPSGRQIVSKLMDTVANAGGEAAQEYVQFFTENWTKALLGMKDENGDVTKANFNFADPNALYSAMLGAINSIAINASTNALTVPSNVAAFDAASVNENTALTSDRSDYVSEDAYNNAQTLRNIAEEIEARRANGQDATAAQKYAYATAESDFYNSSYESDYDESDDYEDDEFVDSSEETKAPDEDNGFDVSENDKKVFDAVKNAYRFGDKLAQKYTDIVSDYESTYNPDTLKAATNAIYNAVNLSNGVTNFNQLYDARSTVKSEALSNVLNNPALAMISESDRNALFQAALEDKLSNDKMNILSKGKVYEPSGLTLETKNNESLDLITRSSLDEFGKHIGTSITLSQTLELNADGIFNKKTGAIMLSFDADAGTGFHEVTHMVRVYSPKNYNEIREASIEAFIRDYGQDAYDKRINEIIENYESQTGQKYNRDAAEEEFVADTMKAFADKEYASEFAKNHMTLAQKFKNLLKNICDLLNNVFTAVEDNAGSKALKNHLDMYEKAYNGLSEGIEEAKRLKSEGYGINDSESKFSLIVNEDTNAKLYNALEDEIASGNYTTTFKAYLKIGDTYYSPMASLEKDENGKYTKLRQGVKLGEWIASEGKLTEEMKVKMPIKAPKAWLNKYKDAFESGFNPWGYYLGAYKLAKSDENGKRDGDIDAAYNPYQHSSDQVLNDQFEGAYDRPNIVVVECRIPNSELDNPYWSPYAKDPTGKHEWKSGPIAGQLDNTQRSVYMTRYIKPVRELSSREVARKISDVIRNEDKHINIYWNTLNPSVLTELQNLGIEIDPYGSPMHIGKKNAKDMYGNPITDEIRERVTAERKGIIPREINREIQKSFEKGTNKAIQENTKKFAPEPLYDSDSKYNSYSLKLDSKLTAKAEKLNANPKNETFGHADPNALEDVKVLRDGIADRLKGLEMFLPADIPGQTMKSNGSYGKSIENSLICPRSLVSSNFMDKVSTELGRPLDINEQIIVSQVLADVTGNQRECTYCYVKNDRAKYRAFFGDYFKAYEDLFNKVSSNKDAYAASINEGKSDSNKLYSAYLDGRKNTDPMWERYKHIVQDGINGKMSIELSDLATATSRNEALSDKSKSWLIKDSEDYCRSAAWPTATGREVRVNGKKTRIEYVSYNGSILNMKPDLINYLNSEYGLRMYSYSDYMPHNILENIQMVTDASVRGLKMLAYTKDVGFAKVFAPSGMGINISVFGEWDAKTGTMVADEMMGAEWKQAQELRKQYNNVGTVFVATNDQSVEWALEQDWIDVVIPFHTVRTGTEFAAAYGYTNYKNSQADEKIADVWKQEGWKDNHLASIPPTMHGNNREAYFNALKENGLTPRFSQYQDNPNYMKLVNETRMAYSDMNPVQPIFNADDVYAEVDRIEKEGTYGLLQGLSDREAQEDLLDDYAAKAISKINGDVKLSLKEDRINDIRDLEDRNNHLYMMNESLNDNLTDANGYNITDTQINRIADKYVKYFGSEINRKDVTEKLKSMYDFIGNTSKINARQLSSVAKSIAEEIMDKSVEKDTSMSDAYPTLAKELRSYKMTVTEEARKDLAKAYDTYGNFRKTTFGKLNLVKEGTKSDVIYGELSERYPDLFPSDIINETDQIIRIAEVADMLTAKKVETDFGDDYESIAYTIGQEMIGEFFKANGNAKYMESIAKIKSDMREEFREKERYLRQQNLDKINELTAKYNKSTGDLKEKYKEQILRLRADKKNSLAKLNERYREMEDRKAARKFDSEARKRLLKEARSLKKMKGTPQFEMYKKQLIGNLDLVATRISEGKMLELMNLRDYAKQQAALDKDFAILEYPKYEKAFERLDKKPISELETDDVIALTELVLALKHSQQTYNKTLREDLGAKVSTLGRNLVDQQSIVKGIDKNADIRSLAQKYLLDMQNPTRAMAMLDGYQKDGIMQILGKGLNDGQTKAERFKMESTKMFDDVLKNKELVNSFSKADIDIGNGVKISKGMRIALYLHSKNYQNMKHIAKGGIKIPDAKLYNEGRYKEAYREGKRVHLKPTQIDAIVNGMTEDERAFADVAYKFFNEKTKEAINETSLVLNGYEKAVVENYFPIKTDPNFTQRDISGLVMDSTIEGMGMLKERIEGAVNPILLEDVSQVISRQMNNTALYYGLAIPVRDFNKVYNYQSTGYESSSKDALDKTWGDTGTIYVKQMLQDIQNGRKSEGMLNAFFDKSKSMYAASVLNMNLGVTIKQTASYPFALTVLDAESLSKGLTTAFKKADYDYMDSITPWSWARRQGMSGTELGEVYKQKTVVDKNSALQGIKDKLNWIQMTDVWTTNRLFFATEEYVKKHNPSLEVRGEEYNKKVADLYNEVLQRTQPSYGVMQRNAFLRDPNAITKALSAFKTQTFNMGGEVIDAWSRAKAYQSLEKKGKVTSKDVAEAKKQLATTMVATAMSQATLVTLAAVANAVLHKMKNYRDDKGEVTKESVLSRVLYEFATSFAGLGFLGSEVQTFALSKVGTEKWYGVSLPQLDSINSFASTSSKWSETLRKLIEERSADNLSKFVKSTEKLAMSMAILKGIPANNVYNILNAAYLWGQDFKNDMLGSFEAGEGLLGLSDTSVESKAIYNRMFDALDNGDYDKYKKTYQELLKTTKEDSVQSKINEHFRSVDAVKNASTDWRKYYYGKTVKANGANTYPEKDALINSVKDSIGKNAKIPEISNGIEAALKYNMNLEREKDPIYNDVKDIKDKYSGDELDKQLKSYMRGKSVDDQKLIWRMAGRADSTFKKQ